MKYRKHILELHWVPCKLIQTIQKPHNHKTPELAGTLDNDNDDNDDNDDDDDDDDDDYHCSFTFK